MRAVHCLVAAATPAGAPRQERAVIASSNKQLPGGELLLKVALEAKILIPLGEHLVVHASVRTVASGAAFPHCFVLEHERPSLRDMALGAGICLRSERKAAALDRVSFVRIVTIPARDLPFQHRMMVGQIEAAFHIQVALETDVGRFSWIENCVPRATRFRVNAARPVATLAADIFRVPTVRLELEVSRRFETLHHCAMAFGTILIPHKFGAGNLRWNDHYAVDRDARNQNREGQQHQPDWQDPRPLRVSAFRFGFSHKVVG